MGITSASKLSREELLRLLDDVPQSTRWDIVQLALDLVGLDKSGRLFNITHPTMFR